MISTSMFLPSILRKTDVHRRSELYSSWPKSYRPWKGWSLNWSGTSSSFNDADADASIASRSVRFSNRSSHSPSSSFLDWLGLLALKIFLSFFFCFLLFFCFFFPFHHKVRNGDYEKYAKWIMKILILNSYQIVKNVWFFSLQYTDGPYLLEFDYSLFTWLISSQWNVFVKKDKVIWKKTNGFMLNGWLIHYSSYKWLKKSMVLNLTVENYIPSTKRQNGNAISLL